MSAPPQSASTLNPDEIRRQSALAIALAAATAVSRKGDVIVESAQAALKEGLDSNLAANLAMLMARVVGERGVEALTEAVASAAETLSASGWPPPGFEAPRDLGTGQATTTSAELIDSLALNRALIVADEEKAWCPLARIGQKIGVNDIAEIKRALEDLAKKDFVRIENDHVYVTESGGRFLKYSSFGSAMS